jgi:hypothetical protein
MRIYIREAFSTRHVLALMWFLACMSPNVNGERAPLDEALATPWSHTGVGALIGVYAIVSLEVGLAVEALGCCISGPANPIACTSYLVARLPITLKWSRIRFILYQFHYVHPAALLRCVQVGLALNAASRPNRPVSGLRSREWWREDVINCVAMPWLQVGDWRRDLTAWSG